MRDSHNKTTKKTKISADERKSSITFAAPSYKRISDNHTELNKTARILGAGLAAMQELADSDPSGDALASIVRKISSHWRGAVPFADLSTEIHVAKSTVSRLLLVQAVASFEHFVTEAEAECDHALGSTPKIDDVTTTTTHQWSSVIKRHHRLCERLTGGSTNHTSEHLMLMGEMFIRIRNRVAHSSSELPAASLEEMLASENLAVAWRAIAEETVSKIIPVLTVNNDVSIPVLELTHAVLASVVFHRLAGSQRNAFLAMDAERRILTIAVREMLKEESPHVTPDKMARRVSYFLSNGGCTYWSSDETIPALREHGLWDRALKGLKRS